MLSTTLKNTRHGSPLGNERGGFCIVTVEHPSPGSFNMRKAWNRVSYNEGDVIGECIYLKDAEPYISPQGKILRRAVFKCRCNKEFEAAICQVKTFGKKSCGCINTGEWNKTHGLSKSTLFNSWTAMKARCYNPNKESYPRYGGRGITVCDEWLHDFKAYYDYVTSLPNARMDGLTIDRIDNNGNYEPDNLRWATHSEQMLNREKYTHKK